MKTSNFNKFKQGKIKPDPSFSDLFRTAKERRIEFIKGFGEDKGLRS